MKSLGIWDGDKVTPRKKWQHKYPKSWREIEQAIKSLNSEGIKNLIEIENKTFKREYILRKLVGALTRSIRRDLLTKLGLPYAGKAD